MQGHGADAVCVLVTIRGVLAEINGIGYGA